MYNAETRAYEKDYAGVQNMLSFGRSKIIEWFSHVQRADGKIIKGVTERSIIGQRLLEAQNTMERCGKKGSRNAMKTY